MINNISDSENREEFREYEKSLLWEEYDMGDAPRQIPS